MHLGIQLQVYVSSLSTPKVLKIYRKTVPSFFAQKKFLTNFFNLEILYWWIISTCSWPCSACFSELKLLTSTHWPTMRSRRLDICHIIFLHVYWPNQSQGLKPCKKEQCHFSTILTEQASSNINIVIWAVQQIPLSCGMQYMTSSDKILPSGLLG